MNSKPSFGMISEVNPNPQLCIIPQNYRGNNENDVADMVSMTGFPTLSSRSDYFNTWLAQNSNIVNLQMGQESANYGINQTSAMLNGVNNTTGNILTGNVSGAIGSGLSTSQTLVQNEVNHEYYIKNQMAQIEKQAMLPDTANLSSSNATLIGYNLFEKNLFYVFNIKRQFAERIDKYFDMYGYLTNTLKIPNLNNRPNWNYVKTQGLNIIANIPQEDTQIIQNMFDNGVTLWHNPATFLDYSQNNR